MTIRGSFPTQFEATCEKGHVHRYYQGNDDLCPLCVDPPPRTRVVSEAHKATLRGNSGRPRPLTAEEIATIRRMYGEGRPMNHIVKALGRGATKIKAALAEMNL